MEGKESLGKYTVVFLAVILTVGIAGHIFDLSRELMITLTPWALLVNSAVVLRKVLLFSNKRIYAWFIISFIFTLATEIIGVKTKLVFGNYNYTDVLGLAIAGVPLIIGVNWIFVILGALKLSEILKLDRRLIPLASSLVCVVFDFILEPVAIKLNYWTWAGNVIPSQNFIAWFLIAAVCSYLYLLLKVQVKSILPVVYLGMQTIFFIGILLLA